MPNPRYDAGARFERRVKEYLESKGFWVCRSAGSRSAIDLLAIKAGEIMLCQCKVDGRLSQVEREQLLELEQETGGYAVIASRDGRRIKMMRLEV